MVNDLVKDLQHAKCLLYADDLKLVMGIETEPDCILLQTDLDHVFRWSIADKLYFNSTKCQIMTFTRRICPINFKYTMEDQPISRVVSVKDLGVKFDCELTFRDHICSLAKESYRRLGFVMRNVREFHNPGVIKLLYTALVRSKLEASACVWSPSEAKYKLMVEKVQKAFLRFLYKKLYGYYPYMYPTKFLLGILGFNSLEVRRNCERITTVCKVLHNKINCMELHNLVNSIIVPPNKSRRRTYLQLSDGTGVRATAARRLSPLCDALNSLNGLLRTDPQVDIFVDSWPKLTSRCLSYCEMCED
jgi:hypothetical protein